MSIQLIPASFTQTDSSANNSARAISASITTSSGRDLFVAAVSQKKIGQFAKADTPRMALFSFLTGLQSSSESSINKLIVKAVSQAADSVHSFVNGRNGAPCSLAVAIVLDQQLYSLQIGAGKIALLKDSKLVWLDHTLPERWLGETLQTETFDPIAIQELTEAPLSILVCQNSFADLLQASEESSADSYSSSLKAERGETLPSTLADWGRQQGLEQELTLATLHTDYEIKNVSENEHPAGPLVREETIEPLFPAQPAPSAPATFDQESEISPESPIPEDQSGSDLSIQLDAPQANPAVLPKPLELPPSVTKNKSRGNGNGTESEVPLNDYVLFSSAKTMPSQAIDAAIAAPIMPAGFSAEATTKVSPAAAPIAAPQMPKPTPKGQKDSQKYKQLKSFVWPLIAALCTVLILLLSYRFFVTRWGDSEGSIESAGVPGDIALDQSASSLTPTIPPMTDEPSADCTRPGSNGDCELAADNVALTETATATITPTQTSTPSPTPTSTNSPTPSPTETPVPTLILHVGQFIQTAGGSSDSSGSIELGDTLIIDRLARVVFSDAVSTDQLPETLDEVYAFAGSVLSFGSNDQGARFEAEQGTTLLLNSQTQEIQAFLPAGNWTLANQNGCMGIDYSRADRPIIASCFAGTCSWTDGSGDENQFAEGERVSLSFASVDERAVPVQGRINGAESLAFYRQLSADASGAAVANRCIARFLPPPTAVPTATPTATPIPPTPRPPSNSGSNNPPATSTPPPPTSTVSPTAESTPTKEQLPERPTATPSPIRPTTVPDITPEATAENPVFPPTSTPLP